MANKKTTVWIGTGGLYIVTDKAMEAEYFWSGLIDDVPIYNGAVNPWEIKELM